MAKEHDLIKGVEYYLDDSKKNTGFFDHSNEHAVFFKSGEGRDYPENIKKLIGFHIEGYDYEEVGK